MDASNPFGDQIIAPRDLDAEALYERWFQEADNDRDGRLTGADAVAFFARSGLPRPTLARVWALADARREGFLDATSFQRAMHLIALAQAGQEVSADALTAAIGRGEPLPRPSMGGGGDGGADAATTSGASPARPQARPLKPPPPLPPSSISSVVDGLASIYFSRIKPLEDAYKFGSFFSASYVRGDFNAKPSVLLLGQYSTGKTSFVEFCLGRPYPGSHVAPEPSTDRFVVVTSGPEDRRTPGHTLVVQPDLPYTSLASFGNGFLSKLEGVAVSGAPILDSLTFVDSPGVLSGEKQRVERSFNFVEVVSHLASRADAVYLFFDPAKLDISDEFKAVISGLEGQTEKIRVVLNKCDTVTAQELMRVYGSLMYSLARVTRAPEVPRVYVGSFKQQASPSCKAPAPSAGIPGGAGELFQAEAADLIRDLAAIPSRAMDRKVADLVKRVRAARIHALVIGHLRRQLPAVVGRTKAQAKLLADLPAAFEAVAREHRLPLGDFPEPSRYRQILQSFELADFPKLRDRDVRVFEEVLGGDIPALVRRFENPYGPAGGVGR